MALTYKLTLYFHILVGFSSLVFFWIPVMAKKGSALHARTGHWYVKAMYLVGFSALGLSAMLMIDPMGFKFAERSFDVAEVAKIATEQRDIGLFLMAISALVLVGVRHGLQAVRAKGNHALMRRADSISINVVLLAVGLWLGYTATGSSPLSVLFYIFAGLCAFTAIGNLRFCLKTKVTRAEQIIAHLSAIIGAGIGAHTAFFLFGASRLFAGLLTGYFSLIPWVLPGVVGTFLIYRQAKKYRPKKPKKLKVTGAVVANH